MGNDKEEVELPSWAKIQKKTFTNWVNVHLADRQLKIADLASDLSDGVMLLNLLEVISAKRFGRYNKTTKFQSQKLENVAMSLKFLKDEGIKLVAIGPEDVVEKRIKLILGLIWTIILRWQIQKITDGSDKTDAKAELIAWVNSVIPHNPVKNLKKDWQDGKALAALTNYLVPGSVDVTPEDEADALQLVTKAVNAADKEAQVPAVISPEDIVSPDLDELSMMTYVAMFRDRANQLRSGDPSKFEAYGPGLKKPVTGKRNQFTVEARNSAGERVKAGGHPVNCHFVPENSLDTAPAKVKDAKNGTYPVSYVPRIAGKYLIHVQVGDVPIKNSPFPVTVADPTPYDVTKTTVDPNISEKEGVTPRTYYTTVITRNASGEPITVGGAAIVANIVPTNGRDEIDSIVEDLEDGTYEILFQRPPEGEYKVSVGLPDASGEKVSQHVTNSPFNFLIDANGDIQSNVPVPSPAHTTVEGDGVEKGKTDKPSKFTIHARDVNGKDIPALPIHFVASVTDPSGAKHPIELTPEGDVLVGKYVPETPGDYTVEVNVAQIRKTPETPVKDSPFTVPVLASANASRSELTGPGIAEDHTPVTTDPSTYTIKSYDKNGNPLAQGGEDFQAYVKEPNGNEKKLEVQDNGDGTYGVTYTPQSAGEHALHVKIGDENVNNSPAVLEVLEAPSAENTVVEGDGVEKGKTDKPSSFKVHAKNAKGDSIPAPKSLFTATVTDPNGNQSTIDLIPDGDGLRGEYTPVLPGDHTVAVNVKDNKGNETPVKDSPFSVPISVSPNASNSKLSGPGITDKDSFITTTEPSHFTIHSFDKDGKPLTKGGEKFEVSVDGPSNVQPEVKDNEDGTYQVTFAPQEAGSYKISVKCDNDNISNSPATVDVEEGADEENTFAVDYMFTIEAKTKSGATRVRGGDKFEVTITSKEGVEVEGVRVEDLASEGTPGKYRVWYTLPGSGKYSVKATLNGKNIKGSPWKQSL